MQPKFIVSSSAILCSGLSDSLSPLSFPKKPSAWQTQVADPLVPNQILGFFEFFREREGVLFSRLGKTSSVQIQGNLKMRRLPPTAPLIIRDLFRKAGAYFEN